MKAYKLNNLDRQLEIHEQAFLNFAVTATKKVGKHKEKPIYTRFTDFFDYEKEINKMTNAKGNTNKKGEILESVTKYLNEKKERR